MTWPSCWLQPVISHPAFAVEPWAVRETELDLDHLAQTESVFALANGHIGLRGNLDEGEPFGLPGTYLNGFYELRPMPYAEAGYGNPEAGQTIVNVTNAKIIRLLVDDEPFDLRYGQLRRHERRLDLRAGVLQRRAEWVPPTGQAVRIASTRLVSFSQRAVAADPLRGGAASTRRAGWSSSPRWWPTSRCPPATAILARPRPCARPCSGEFHDHSGDGAMLVHHTEASGLRMAVAMDHLIDGSARAPRRQWRAFPISPGSWSPPTWRRDNRCGVTKFIAYGWSRQRSTAAVRDQVRAALVEALPHRLGRA